MAQASLDAIKPFQAPKWEPGQSGNPAGKPKGARNRNTVLKEMLGLKMPKDKNGKEQRNPLDPDDQDFTVEKGVTAALLRKALQGDVNAIREVLDTAYGKNKDVHEITGKDGAPIETSRKNFTLEEAAQAYADAIKAEE